MINEACYDIPSCIVTSEMSEHECIYQNGIALCKQSGYHCARVINYGTNVVYTILCDPSSPALDV